ncbi:MAG: ABC transporter ATP-binding protein [bacterium]|nr:ABC transporter ATP-binding protein [bacterium]
MQFAIRCQNLVKTYRGKPPVEAVKGLDLEVLPGECFGVLGPNGAGKTTTIEILEGLLAPTSGSVEVLGMSWDTQADAIRQRMGVSLQETQLSERLTVRETMQLFRSFYRSGMTVDEAIELVALSEKANAWVKNLSGGQKQRLAVATSVVGDPDILFLDEPTTGLDPTSRRQLWDIIRSFRERNKTILLTTHYMEEAERLCDRVAIVDSGRIIAIGTPRELISSLGAEHVIEFMTNSDLGSSDDGASFDWLKSLPSVDRIESDHSHHRIIAGEPHAVLPALFAELKQRDLRLANLTTRHASLEDVFVSLTGRHLNEN